MGFSSLVEDYIVPISILIELFIIIPQTPHILRQTFKRFLWDRQVSSGSVQLKMIHVLLIIAGILALNKMYEYNHAWETA